MKKSRNKILSCFIKVLDSRTPKALDHLQKPINPLKVNSLWFGKIYEANCPVWSLIQPHSLKNDNNPHSFLIVIMFKPHWPKTILNAS